jgi:sensor c-di-GMP phosphodiesterase-like protein
MSIVVDEACAQHRQTLATAAAEEHRAIRAQAETTGSSMKEVTSAVRECVTKSHQQHRQSLLQAAEIVELASLRDKSGVSEDWGAAHLTPAQLTAQLQLVQQAIQGARQSHRKSIIQAMPTLQLPKGNAQGDMESQQSDRKTECVRANIRRKSLSRAEDYQGLLRLPINK